MVVDFLKDVFKCAKVALVVSSIVWIIFAMVYYLFYRGSSVSVLMFIKDRLYNVGCFGFLASVGFFMQRDATRPLDNQKQWENIFYKLNLGIVIMTVSTFICLYGMIIQLFLEGSVKI